MDKYLWIEDVYVSGILRTFANLSISPMNNILLHGEPPKHKMKSKNFLAFGLRKNYDLKTQRMLWIKYVEKNS